MLKPVYSLFVLLLISSLTYTQQLDHSLSVTSFATLHQNKERNTPFDIFLNPATGAFFKGFALGVCSEQKWGQKDILSGDISAIWATKNGTWALPIHIDKAGGFNNSTPSVIYARKLAANLGLALQIGYNMQHVEKYGSQQKIDTKLGLVVRLTDQLQMGASIQNPQLWFKHNVQAINQPVSVSCQTVYEPSKTVLLQAIFQKQQNQPTQVIAGIYYRCYKYVEVSAGINSEGHQFWGSGSIIWKAYRLGITTSVHPQLGITPGLCFIYNAKNN